jgi:two-component system sensor histidine kinase DesK
MVLWSSAWLCVLGAPASEIWRGADHPAAVAGGALLAFAALFVAVWWVASDAASGLRLRAGLLGMMCALAVGCSLAFHQSWPFMFYFVAATVACALPRRWAIVGIAALLAIDVAVVNVAAPTMMFRQIFGVLIAGFVVLFIIRMLELIRELNAARLELARLAVADERVRFARDLHDLLGHTLSLIVVKSEAVRRLVRVDADAAARESNDIELVSRQALAEVREAVTNYRERSLDVELEGARVALSAAGIEATIRNLPDRLPDDIESVLGWTVREGVTNVVRHSNGRHCAIDLRQSDGVAVLEICDDGDPSGASFASAGARLPVSDGASKDKEDSTAGERSGSGLRGLAERLAAAHGRLEAGRRPDGGFRLAVTVPLEHDGQETV